MTLAVSCINLQKEMGEVNRWRFSVDVNRSQTWDSQTDRTDNVHSVSRQRQITWTAVICSWPKPTDAERRLALQQQWVVRAFHRTYPGNPLYKIAYSFGAKGMGMHCCRKSKLGHMRNLTHTAQASPLIGTQVRHPDPSQVSRPTTTARG